MTERRLNTTTTLRLSSEMRAALLLVKNERGGDWRSVSTADVIRRYVEEGLVRDGFTKTDGGWYGRDSYLRSKKGE